MDKSPSRKKAPPGQKLSLDKNPLGQKTWTLGQKPTRKSPLMIDGDKKVVSKQPFASFPKVNSLQCQNRIDVAIRNEL